MKEKLLQKQKETKPTGEEKKPLKIILIFLQHVLKH